MTAADQPPASAPSSASKHSGIGFLVAAALVTVSVALFIVSGFAILSSESGVAQPVATILGGAGVLGAGVLTFRAAHNTRISAAETAASALQHAQNELEHARSVAADEKARHEKQLEEQRNQAEAARVAQSKSFELTHQREAIRDLRSRYTTTAEQLAAAVPAIRLAGVYALASLADDWHDFGNDDERQVCVDLLCAYLRTERSTASTGADRVAPQEQNVRSAIIDVIAGRSRMRNGVDGPWSGLRFALSGANLIDAKLSGANLTNAELNHANLTGANLNHANLAGANLTNANLTDAKLTDANLTNANLTNANLTNATAPSANLIGAQLGVANLTDAKLIGANLTGAQLSGANLTDAQLGNANLTDAYLIGANLTGAKMTVSKLPDRPQLTETYLDDGTWTVSYVIPDVVEPRGGATLTGANLSSILYDTETTSWPAGFTPPPSR